ncbi:MAG: hypothetical protein ACPG32_04020 [Akkermansiaceae bacterium]
MKLLLPLAIALGSIHTAGAVPDSQDVSLKNYRSWMQYIRPSADEMKWKNIAWRNKLMPAVAEAKKLDRPVLLWAMNGNPCGET